MTATITSSSVDVLEILEKLIRKENLTPNDLALLDDIVSEILEKLIRKENSTLEELALLAKLIVEHSTLDGAILADVLWSFTYISGSNDGIDRVIETGCIQYLLEILSRNTSKRLTTPALQTVGNILTGDEAQTNAVLQANGLSVLYQLTKQCFHWKVDTKILEKLCWSISNIAAGTVSQIQRILDCDGLIELLKDIVTGGFDGKVDNATVEEAVFTLSNLLDSSSIEQVQELGNNPKFATLPHLICSMGYSPATALVARNGASLFYSRLGRKECIGSCYRNIITTKISSRADIAYKVVEYVEQSHTFGDADVGPYFQADTVTCLLAMGFSAQNDFASFCSKRCNRLTIQRVTCISTMILFSSFRTLPRIKTPVHGKSNWICSQIPIEIWKELNKFLFAKDDLDLLDNCENENDGEEDDGNGEGEDENSGDAIVWGQDEDGVAEDENEENEN
jgi:hypothetical protein